MAGSKGNKGSGDPGSVKKTDTVSPFVRRRIRRRQATSSTASSTGSTGSAANVGGPVLPVVRKVIRQGWITKQGGRIKTWKVGWLRGIGCHHRVVVSLNACAWVWCGLWVCVWM